MRLIKKVSNLKQLVQDYGPTFSSIVIRRIFLFSSYSSGKRKYFFDNSKRKRRRQRLLSEECEGESEQDAGSMWEQ